MVNQRKLDQYAAFHKKLNSKEVFTNYKGHIPSSILLFSLTKTLLPISDRTYAVLIKDLMYFNNESAKMMHIIVFKW